MYKVEVADQMILKAERLDVEEYEYISYQSGQPRKEELEKLLKARFPKRDYMIIEEINGRTIIRLNDEC
jgi:hypothetical protein